MSGDTSRDGGAIGEGEAERRRRAREADADLFGAAAEPVAGRRVGRPKGSRNLTTQAYARWLQAQHGDPLAAASRIAGIDILVSGNLDALARALGMDRAAAAEFWHKNVSVVLPYHHRRQPQDVILNPGSPGSGERIGLDIPDLIDITP